MKAIGSFIAIPAILFLAGCSGPTGPESVAGHYDLVSVDGEPLPIMGPNFLLCAFGGPCDQLIEYVSSGFILLRADGTYSYNEDVWPTVDKEGEGAFRIDGGSLTFTWSVGDTPTNQPVWRATITDNRVTVPDDNNRVYIKR